MIAPASLIVRNDRSELSRVSLWVRAWAQQHRLPGRLVQILDLCAAEVVTNVISYAYDDEAPHPISLSFAIDDDRISLEVEDEGKPFDPRHPVAHPRPPGLEEGRIGGWGLRIVRHFADDVRYGRADGRNRVTMVFRHPSSAPPASADHLS